MVGNEKDKEDETDTRPDPRGLGDCEVCNDRRAMWRDLQDGKPISVCRECIK